MVGGHQTIRGLEELRETLVSWHICMESSSHERTCLGLAELAMAIADGWPRSLDAASWSLSFPIYQLAEWVAWWLQDGAPRLTVHHRHHRFQAALAGTRRAAGALAQCDLVC